MKDTISGFIANRPFARIGLLAIPMLVAMLFMEAYFPQDAPEGFQSFIVAFEFAKTPQDIHHLLNDFSRETLSDIDTGNYIDFAFMLVYSAFLFLFFKKSAQIFQNRWYKTGMFVAVLILMADFLENISLFQITDIFSRGEPLNYLSPALHSLSVITWIKWGGLAFIFAFYSIVRYGKNIFMNIPGIILLVPAFLMLPALLGSPSGITNFTLGITIAFFVLIYLCFSHTASEKKETL